MSILPIPPPRHFYTFYLCNIDIIEYWCNAINHNHNLLILLLNGTVSPSFNQMCLASEAGKMDVVQSHPEDSSSKASLPQTPLKSEVKEEKVDGDACAPLPGGPAVAPSDRKSVV